MTELEMICQRSGTQVTQCDCQLCQSMCLRAPCIGTPEDIVRLINNGYIHQLETTAWGAGERIGIETFLSVQIKLDTHGGCPLFKNGKCSIHEIKPTDGKLANCKDVNFKKGEITYLHLIAEEWNKVYNNKKMKWIINSLYKYQSTQTSC